MRPQMKSWAFLALSAVLCWGTATQSASATEILDDTSHFTELTNSAMQTANTLCWELHRYHQQQPDFPVLYRDAKEVWTQASTLQNALQNGPVDAAVAKQQIGRMTSLLVNIEKGTAKWGDGVRPVPAGDVVRRNVVVQRGGYGVNVPYFGFRLAAPRVAVAEEVVVPAPANRNAIHPNGRGSRRSLDREIFAVKTALANLSEDIAIPAVTSGTTPVPADALPIAPNADTLPAAPRPQPPVPQPAVQLPTVPDTSATPDEGTVIKVVPSSARKNDTPTIKK